MAQVYVKPSRSAGYVSLQFNYDPAAIELVKLHLTGRRWSVQDRAWNIPYSETVVTEVQRLFLGLGYDVYVNEALTKQRQDEQARARVTEELKQEPSKAFKRELFEFHTEPMRHQQDALAMLTGSRFFALFMEQGTGKTKVMLDFIRGLRKNGKLDLPALVVAPASVIDVWKSEAAKHQPGLRVLVLDGSVAAKAAQLSTGYGENDILVMNYECIWREPLCSELVRHHYSCMILDESTRIMHHSSHQAKQCVKLGKQADRKFILTGTPAPNGPLNLYNQLRFLDVNLVGPSFYAFRDRFVILGGYQNHQVIGYRDQDSLKRIVSSVSYRIKKDECLDLPPKIYEVERVELEPNQRRIYDKLKDEMVAEVAKDKFVSATNALAKLTRLRQIAAGFAAVDDGLFVFERSAKISWLKEHLELNKDSKLVVWGSFIKELDLISEALVEKGIRHVRLDGGTPIDMRAANIKSFQDNPKVRVFLSTARAGGLGITLTSANTVVFMSNEFSGELRMQAEDRAHRIGQKGKVLYIDLLAKNTVDVSTYRLLQKKKQMNDSLSASQFKAFAEGISDEESF